MKNKEARVGIEPTFLSLQSQVHSHSATGPFYSSLAERAENSYLSFANTAGACLFGPPAEYNRLNKRIRNRIATELIPQLNRQGHEGFSCCVGNGPNEWAEKMPARQESIMLLIQKLKEARVGIEPTSLGLQGQVHNHSATGPLLVLIVSVICGCVTENTLVSVLESTKIDRPPLVENVPADLWKYPIYIHQIRGSNEEADSDPQKIETFNNAIEQISAMLSKTSLSPDSVYISDKDMYCRGLNFAKGDTIKQGIHLSVFTDAKFGTSIARVTPCTDEEFVNAYNVFGGRIEYSSSSGGWESIWAHEIFHMLMDMKIGGEVIYDENGKYAGDRYWSEHPKVDSIWRHEWDKARKQHGVYYDGKLPVDGRFGFHWYECASISHWANIDGRIEPIYDIMALYGPRTDSIVITPITKAALIPPLDIHDRYIADYEVYNPEKPLYKCY